MADNGSGIEGRPPDPFVASRINDPGTPAPASFELAGLLGDSDRDGYRRLYLNTSLDYYVEFRTEDVLTVESVSPDQPPFVGLDATRVALNRDAQVAYVHSRPAAASDAFNIDARAGLQGGFLPDQTDPTDTVTDLTLTLPETPLGCQLPTVDGTCGPRCLPTNTPTCWFTQCQTCGNGTCLTCFGTTCQTCNNQATCQTCGQATCQTCDQATCQTCHQPGCVIPVTGDLGTCESCLNAACWHTVGNATCLTCRITACNWNCPVTVDAGCLSQRICPTLKCQVG